MIRVACANKQFGQASAPWLQRAAARPSGRRWPASAGHAACGSSGGVGNEHVVLVRSMPASHATSRRASAGNTHHQLAHVRTWWRSCSAIVAM